VHLVGFIIRIYHDAQSSERQNVVGQLSIFRMIQMPSFWGSYCILEVKTQRFFETSGPTVTP